MDFKSCLVVLLLALAMVAAVESSTIHDATWGLTHSHDDMSEMTGDDNEMLLDSEADRRHLAERKRFISYDALKNNGVPCTRNGQSYYNCPVNQQEKANVYRRACSYITRCARHN